MENIAALLSIATASFVLALSGALMPGPLLTVTIGEAARRGALAGPLLITGHVLLELILIIAIIVGLGPYLEIPLVIGIIGVIGGSILLWMGTGMMRAAKSISLKRNYKVDKHGLEQNPLILGILASISNPYWTIWWITIGLGYMATARASGTAGLIAFFLGHIAADYCWYALVAISISRSRNIIPEKGYQLLIQGCGIFLIGFGLWFWLSSYKYLTI